MDQHKRITYKYNMAPSAGDASGSIKTSNVKSTSNNISAGSASSTANSSTKKSCSSSAPTAKGVEVTTPKKNVCEYTSFCIVVL